MLRKGVYLYEYMDDCDKFNGISFPEKSFVLRSLKYGRYYWSKLRSRNLCRIFEKNTLGEYHDLYVQNDTLLLADVFENFRIMCLKIYEIDLEKAYSDAEIA